MRTDVQGLPTSAYEVVEEVEAEGKEIHRVFKHLPSSVEAEESEAVISFYLLGLFQSIHLNVCVCFFFFFCLS